MACGGWRRQVGGRFESLVEEPWEQVHVHHVTMSLARAVRMRGRKEAARGGDARA